MSGTRRLFPEAFKREAVECVISGTCRLVRWPRYWVSARRCFDDR